MAKRQNSDDLTLALIEQVDVKRKEIFLLKKSFNNRTNCTFSYNENVLNSAVNLNTMSKVDDLIKIAAFILQQKEAYENASALMEVAVIPQFKWMGFSADDWIFDIKNKIGRIQLSLKEQSLSKLETRLDAIISPELKRKRELESIAAELNN